MKTAFSRIFYPAAIVLLAALLLVGCLFQLVVKEFMQQRTVSDLQGDCATIADLASAYQSQGIPVNRELAASFSAISRVSGTDAVLCSVDGRLLLCSDAPLGCSHQGWVLNRDYVRQVLRQGTVTGKGTVPGLYADARYVVSKPVQNRATGEYVGIVMVSSPVADATELLTWLSQRYMIISVLVILISVLTMTVLVRQQSHPLRDMAKAASAFGHGDLDARVAVDAGAPREVQALSLAFNNMADSLQKSEYQRQEFIANVSHELKTPMTTISGFVDGMLDGTIPQEKFPQYMRLVSDETKRLSRLVRSMLDISRLQSQGGIPEERKTRFEIAESLGTVLISFEQKILEKKLDVQVHLPEHPVYTRADKDAITQVIYNLVDNAVKFCPEAGRLELRLREGTEKVYVSVANSGQTIPPEELPLVFDRFHKLDKSRSQNREGWGLGLYIVKTLVCSHGEDISVTSRQGRTEFTFTLPLVM